MSAEDSVLNNIFDHSKQRIMEAIEGVQSQVDTLEQMKEVWETALKGKSSIELDSGMIMSVCSPSPLIVQAVY